VSAHPRFPRDGPEQQGHDDPRGQIEIAPSPLAPEEFPARLIVNGQSYIEHKRGGCLRNVTRIHLIVRGSSQMESTDCPRTVPRILFQWYPLVFGNRCPRHNLGIFYAL
jgi:hypothetical protein